MADIAINAAPRSGRGKEDARRVRGQGRIPGVVYGSGKAATELSLDLHELTKILARPDAARSLFDLHVEGQAPRLVLLKEIQRHMIKGTPRHADFLEVDETKPIVVNVPVHVTGHAKGLLQGGLQEMQHREVRVRCLPRAIPREFVAVVSDLALGDSLHVSDLKAPEGVEILDDPITPVVSIIAPQKGVEETAAAAPVEGAVAAAGAAPAAAKKADKK